MIIYQDNGDAILDLGSRVFEEVLKWETWFMSPMGLMDNLPETIKRMKEHDLPLHLIRPVPVAIGKSGNYEAIL